MLATAYNSTKIYTEKVWEKNSFTSVIGQYTSVTLLLIKSSVLKWPFAQYSEALKKTQQIVSHDYYTPLNHPTS